MTAYDVFQRFLSAYNSHDLNGVLANYDPSCTVVVNEKLYADNIEKIKKTYEGELSQPGCSARVIRYVPLKDTDERSIRVVFETQDGAIWDITYLLGDPPNNRFVHVSILT